MDTQDTSFGAPPSGLPPLAWLSGLSLGQVGLGGQQDGSLSGAGRFAEGVGAPGAEGLGLDALAQMFAAMQGGDVASAASDSPIGTGTLAQGGGTLGQANAGPTGGYAVAGQTAGAGAQQAAEGQAAGSMDPLAIIQKILGVAQKGLGGALGAGGGQGGGTGGGEGQGGTVGGGGYLSAGQQQPSPLGFPTSGYSLAGPQEGNPLAGIAQDQQGAFLGTNVLQDPTFGPLLTQGLLTGSLTPADLSNLSTLSQDQIAGLRTALLGGDVQSDLGSQLLSGQGGTQGFTLGAGTASPTNWGGVAQGGLAGALGLLNILQSAQGGNVAQGVGGGLQGLGGLTQILKSSPELAQALGLGSGTLGQAGAALGGLGGLLGLAGGVQGLTSGDLRTLGPALTQLAGGGLATYQAAQSLFPQLLGTATSGASGGLGAISALGAIYGLMGQGDPTGGAQTGAALTGLAATTPGALSAVGVAPAIAGTVGGTLGAVAPVIAAVVAALGNADEMRAREAGYTNNPIKQALYSGANVGTGNVAQLADRIEQGGGFSALSDQGLKQALQYSLNNLMPYFQTAQGGKGAVRASDTVTGTLGQEGITTDSPEAYTQRYNTARDQTLGLINELLARGVPYSEIGSMALGFNPAFQSLDAANPWEQFYAPQASKWQQEAAALVGQSGVANTGLIDPMQALMGTDALNNPKALAQFNTLTQAFGGPTAYWLARLGIAPQAEAQALFDPLRNLRGRTQADLAEIVSPAAQQAAMTEAQRYQDFTSGGM